MSVGSELSWPQCGKSATGRESAGCLNMEEGTGRAGTYRAERDRESVFVHHASEKTNKNRNVLQCLSRLLLHASTVQTSKSTVSTSGAESCDNPKARWRIRTVNAKPPNHWPPSFCRCSRRFWGISSLSHSMRLHPFWALEMHVTEDAVLALVVGGQRFNRWLTP